MKWFTVVVLSMHAFSSFAQNLVPNAGFEDYIQCPDYPGQIEFSTNWLGISSPDYFNICGLSGYCGSLGYGIPINCLGNQLPRNGSAYSGLYVYDYVVKNAREYLYLKLKRTLESNSKYYISFNISLAENSKYGISNFGIFFSRFNPDTNLQSIFDYYNPQIKSINTNYFTNMKDWVEIGSSYTAIGNEKYITIGNFSPDSKTNYILINSNVSQNYSYYYIDDVLVIKIPNQDISLVELVQECYSEKTTLQLSIQNTGLQALDFTVDTFTFNAEVFLNGQYFQTVTLELSNNQSNPIPGLPLEPEASMKIDIGPFDLSNYDSSYTFQIKSFSTRDSNSTNDSLWKMMVPTYSPDCFSLIIPNVFTPNGDKVNDTFYFHNAEGKELSTQIFNRWGTKVGSWKGNAGWDGHNLPAGVYFYLVREKIGETENIYRGKVTLLR